MRSSAPLRRFVYPCLTLTLLLVLPTVHGGEENAAQGLARRKPATRDLSDPEQKALYCVGYAHLDTQWRWDFVTTIDQYIRSTLDDNFARFEKYPDYTFNFTGSVRYEMMKEYYPKRYEQLKQYIEAGRWFVSGSSVDEGDVNVPSAESIVRQVLYGNLFFKREFGKESVDFMLPDCFGFPASMPSLWAHCGLLGFSTQKLTWGSAVGIPFPIGIWEGPDGNGVLAALDPGSYARAIEGRVDQNPDWIARVQHNGNQFGVWADYHYYGVGDQGGAPREQDVANYVASRAAADRQIDLVLGSSDQLFRDITPDQRQRLPSYRGDMLLTEHSAGTLTSQSMMKRWNRQAEQLADAAERAAVASDWLGQLPYPRHKLERAWIRILANQMHDILPGTSIPRAYRYSWNDDVVGLNHFASVLTSSVAGVSAALDTDVQHTPVVVVNPLTLQRTDVVEAAVPAVAAPCVRVFDPSGREVPSQVLKRDADRIKVLFLATVEPNSFTVFDVRPASQPYTDEDGPRVGRQQIENHAYRVVLDDAGNISEIVDKSAQRQLLAKPASLVFTHERPRQYPAWNMDWADRQRPPMGTVDGPPQFRVVERGPVRAAIAVTRHARDSEFTQVLRLTRGDPGQMLEIAATIDWQSTGCALKAAFPLTIANPLATYNWGMGTVQRGNNEPVKYEVPSHEWFDLTGADNAYGVTLVEDSKFGSDKPADNELRLTLLYTPGVRGSFMDQHSQDWGIHHLRYGLFGHSGNWRRAGSAWRGRRFNQPLRAFVVDKHPGRLGRSFCLARCNTAQVDVRAIKVAEAGDAMIVRVQELWGQAASEVELEFPAAIVQAEEVDGQERSLGRLAPAGNRLVFDLPAYGMRSFALELASPRTPSPPRHSVPVALAFDTDIASSDSDRSDGAMDSGLRSYPAELLPPRLMDGGVEFKLGSGHHQALSCRGQQIDLEGAAGNQIHVLAAATDDVTATFGVGSAQHVLAIQAWTGFVGQWYDRVWNKQFDEVDYKCDGEVRALLPAFIKRDPIAWFATHRHHPQHGNEAYRFCYIYHYVLPRPDPDDHILTLPFDERIRVFAISVASGTEAHPAAPLYDAFEAAKPIAIRHQYAAPPEAVFTGHAPIIEVQAQRSQRFDEPRIGPPRTTDDIDASRGGDYAFEVHTRGDDLQVHPGSGAIEGRLGRLNDGLAAEHHDDTQRCIWYDNEGRFSLDLEHPRALQRIDTYSWHRSNRAPQYFSLWGCPTDPRPDVLFKAGETTDWELIAVVDTRTLGDGGIHATRIEQPEGTLGPYRHLLWVCPDIGEGTFFTEIDIDFAKDAR